MTADPSALIARLEAAEAGSRELDCEIAVLLGGFYICTPRYEGAPVAYGYVDEDGVHIEPGHGGAQMVPRYTTSLDAALALAERVCGDREWMIVRSNEDGVTSYHALIGPDSVERAGESRSPALALVIATLRAKLDGYEVNKNPKAQEG